MRRVGWAVAIAVLMSTTIVGMVWLDRHLGGSWVFVASIGAIVGLWAWRTAGDITAKERDK